MLLTLRIQLADIKKPPVWRQLTVPDGFSFHRLHEAIQAAFGWQDSHLYLFAPEGHHSATVISIPYEDDDDFRKTKDSRKVKLSTVFKTAGQHYVYIYDFGDNWTHLITVEKTEDAKATKAACTGGKGACPPEDCGGWPGYEDFKAIMADPKHPEYEDMREWMGMEPGEKWDPAAFDPEAANQRLKEV